jgi:signal transduction histidine kinase
VSEAPIPQPRFLTRPFPKSLIPASLGGQLAAVMIVALLMAHLAILTVFSSERSQAVDAALRFGVIERIATLAGLVDGQAPELGNRAAEALSSRLTRLTISAQSVLPEGGMSPAEADFALSLGDELGLKGGMPRVRLSPAAAGEPDVHGHHGGTNVAISIPMNDGQWLNATSTMRTPSIAWSSRWLISLVASAAATLFAVALVVGRITGPMRALAAAAEKVGRGETVAPVEPAGPSEIRAAVETFNDMQARLSRFVRDRTRMIAAISHDLRTPVTSLRVRAEFIEDEELKEDVIRTLDEMQAMTEATLSFAREADSVEATRSVDLAALVEGIAEDQVALGRAVTYAGPDRLVWRCRPYSLKRAIGNLVDNAVRYAGSAQLSLTEAGGEAVITVEDDGPGIPARSLAEVFEPFVRVEDSRSRETGGVGLGLAIARSIVHAHGGEIRLANRPGRGLAARVSLP